MHIRLQIIHTCVVAKIHSHMCMWKKIQMANPNKHIKGGSRGSRGTAAMVPAPPPKNGKVVMLAEDRQTGLFFRSLFDTLSPIPSPLQQVLGRWFSEGRHLEIAGWQTSLHGSSTGPNLVFFFNYMYITKIFFQQEGLGWNEGRVRVEGKTKAWVEGDIIKTTLQRVNKRSSRK